MTLAKSNSTRQFAKSERKAVRKALADEITRLKTKYLPPLAEPTSGFPSNDELNHIDTLFEDYCKLYRSKAPQCESSGSLWQSLNTTKLKLVRFADDLCAKVGRIPLSPMTSIYQKLPGHIQWAIDQERPINFKGSPVNLRPAPTFEEALLKRIYEMLAGKGRVAIAEWASVYRLIKELTSLEFRGLALCTNVGLRMGVKGSEQLESFLGYTAFLDLNRTQMLWRLSYGLVERGTLQWLYKHQNPDYEKVLRRIFHGDAEGVDETKRVIRKFKNNKRQKKHRAKSALSESLTEGTPVAG